ncbi:MAG: efflux RND transporter periplasmic adaptor subunit [Verrucomicrobia bacterium]|nr:efflux RND transporter periplasmic adaptor subunit [Verrucomicrobiota bacterium]
MLLGILAGLLPRWRQRAALAAEHSELTVTSVAVVSPAPHRSGEGLLLPAEIKPWTEAPIYARASGYLKRWLADLGTHVQAGQLLAEIETPELDQELQRARHELAQAEAALALSRITADRYAQLVATASVSEQENAEKQADVKVKTASVAAGRANVARLEQLQSFGRVAAPFAGTITAREADVGMLVSASGGRELFRLAQTDKLRVQVRVPQTEAARIAPGLAVELTIPEQPNRVYTGRVARTSGEISPDSRTLLTEVEVPNADGRILVGSFAQARFVGGRQEERLAVPANALVFGAAGPQVALVQPGGKVELRTVKLGRDFGQAVEILGGVNPTHQIILNPPNFLESGMTVRVAEVVTMPPPMPGQGAPAKDTPGQGKLGGAKAQPGKSKGTP